MQRQTLPSLNSSTLCLILIDTFRDLGENRGVTMTQSHCLCSILLSSFILPACVVTKDMGSDDSDSGNADGFDDRGRQCRRGVVGHDEIGSIGGIGRLGDRLPPDRRGSSVFGRLIPGARKRLLFAVPGGVRSSTTESPKIREPARSTRATRTALRTRQRRPQATRVKRPTIARRSTVCSFAMTVRSP